MERPPESLHAHKFHLSTLMVVFSRSPMPTLGSSSTGPCSGCLVFSHVFSEARGQEEHGHVSGKRPLCYAVVDRNCNCSLKILDKILEPNFYHERENSLGLLAQSMFSRKISNLLEKFPQPCYL